MVKRLLTFVCLLFAPGLTASALMAQAKNPIVFRNVTVIDVIAGQAQPGMTVVISGNRIADVGPASTQIPANAEVIPADGKFLIPGLWDMHMHAIGNLGIREFTNPLLIAHGVTGVRSMGRVALADILQQREAVLDGRAIGPRIVTSGAILDGAYPVWPEAVAVTSPESARSLVDQQKREHADFIKIYSLLGRPEFFAIAEEAKRQNIPFVGHVPGTVTATEASNAGMKSMEHLYGVLEESSSRAEELFARGKTNDQQIFAAKSQGSKDPAIGFVEAFRIWNVAALTHDPVRAARLYKTFVANGTWQVPTLAIARDWAYEDEPEHFSHQPYQYLPYPPQPIVSKIVSPNDMADAKKAYAVKLKMVEEMNRAGVRLLAGTDGPPFLVAEELKLLVTAGLSPAEALRTATSNPAAFLNRTEELGSITKGKLADAVLLNLNPLENIRAVREIDTVVFNGRYLRRSQIDALLSDLAKRAASKPEKQH